MADKKKKRKVAAAAASSTIASCSVRVCVFVCDRVMQTANARCTNIDADLRIRILLQFHFSVCFGHEDCSEVVHWHDSIIHYLFYFLFSPGSLYLKYSWLHFPFCTDFRWKRKKKKWRHIHSHNQSGPQPLPSNVVIQLLPTAYTHFNGFCCKVVADDVHHKRNFYCRASTHLYMHRIHVDNGSDSMGANIVMCISISCILDVPTC